MHQRGHVGLAALAWAPLAAYLLSEGRPLSALVGGVVCVWFATLPDVDMELSGVRHRGPTHSLAFAAATGLATTHLARWLGHALARRVEVSVESGVLADLAASEPVTIGSLAVVAGVGAAVSVCSHVLGDALTPAGVEVLWPISGERFSLSLFQADNLAANYGFFAGGTLVALLLLLGTGVVDLPVPVPDLTEYVP